MLVSIFNIIHLLCSICWTGQELVLLRRVWSAVGSLVSYVWWGCKQIFFRGGGFGVGSGGMFASLTANEGLVSIQYKCLVLIYIFPENETVCPRYFKNRIIMFFLSVSTMPHSCICERFIYSQDLSAYFAADQSWEYMNHSQIHECRNWERGWAVFFLGIHKSYFRYRGLGRWVSSIISLFCVLFP